MMGVVGRNVSVAHEFVIVHQVEGVFVEEKGFIAFVKFKEGVGQGSPYSAGFEYIFRPAKIGQVKPMA